MKVVHATLLATLMIWTTASFGSEWVEQIEAVVPANITLTDVTETEDQVSLQGRANSNTDISHLMRAIDSAKLGSPNLQSIKRDGGVSNFVLNVRAKR